MTQALHSHAPAPSVRPVELSRALAVALPFLVMLSAMCVVPAVRPTFARLGASEGAMHAFMSLNMLGGALGAPLVSWAADRSGAHRSWLVALALADAALVGAFTMKLPVGALLALRVLQGATNVGLLSLSMALVTRSHGATRGAMGAAGAALTAGLALGPAVGGALLGLGPRAPFLAAASINLLVALVASAGLAASVTPARGFDRRSLFRSRPLLVVPWVLAFTERFTVGCFVVSFAVYAHEALGMSDRAISVRFTLFIAAFALSMLPMSRLAEHASRATVLGVGGLGYGAAFLLLAVSRGGWLDAALVLAGMTSSMMYAPSLALVGDLSPPGARATSMALLNAAGCLGMMLGPAVAGILSAVWRQAGYDAGHRYPAIFAVAGLVQLVAMIALARSIASLRAVEQSGGAGRT